MKSPAVYIVANKPGGTIYTGVTSNLIQRIYQHKEGLIPGFSARYKCKTLVWFEQHATMEYAILREKQLKAGSRRDKFRLIEALNPDWAGFLSRLGLIVQSAYGLPRRYAPRNDDIGYGPVNARPALDT